MGTISQASSLERVAANGNPAGQDNNHDSENLSSISGQLRSILQRAIDCLKKSGPELAADYRKLSSLMDRLEEGRFHLAVLGQFKRGKSTLLNALLGEALLPASVVPLTAIPTFIHYGPTRRARVCYLDGRPGEEVTAQTGDELSAFLERIVTEEFNPKNRLSVAHVEVTHPAEILRKGMVLVDTPGIGSTYRHNTVAALNFLPQCDAALFLVSADPPITQVEVDFLQQIRSRVTRLFFLLNKADYLSESERKNAVEFFRKVLREEVGITEETPIYCLSARLGLEAKRSRDDRLWASCGLAEVENRLIEFLASEKAATLRKAIACKAAAILAESLLQVRLSIRSLQMPLDELERKMKVFEQKIVEVEQQRVIARDVLVGDRRRAAEYVEHQAEELRKKGYSHLKGIVADVIAKTRKVPDETAVQDALARPIWVFFEREFEAISRKFECHVTEVLRLHQRRADELIEAVRKNAAELFDVSYRAPEGAGLFELARQPYWVTREWDTLMSPIPIDWLGKLLPAGIRRSRVQKKLMEQVEFLVIRNVEDLRVPTLDAVERAFRRFAQSLDERLSETIAATRGAIESAAIRRAEHADAVADEVNRLESMGAGLTELEQLLENPADQ
jgi:GTP-binding protein EngB required for normal cell division